MGGTTSSAMLKLGVRTGGRISTNFIGKSSRSQTCNVLCQEFRPVSSGYYGTLKAGVDGLSRDILHIVMEEGEEELNADEKWKAGEHHGTRRGFFAFAGAVDPAE